MKTFGYSTPLIGVWSEKMLRDERLTHGGRLHILSAAVARFSPFSRPPRARFSMDWYCIRHICQFCLTQSNSEPMDLLTKNFAVAVQFMNWFSSKVLIGFLAEHSVHRVAHPIIN